MSFVRRHRTPLLWAGLVACTGINALAFVARVPVLALSSFIAAALAAFALGALWVLSIGID